MWLLVSAEPELQAKSESCVGSTSPGAGGLTAQQCKLLFCTKKPQINYFKAIVYRVIFFFPMKVPLRTQNSAVIFPLQLPVQHRTRLSLDGLVWVTGPGTERVLGSTGHLVLLVPRGWTGFG